MIIDLNRYRRVIKPLVKLYFDRNPDKDKNIAITEISNTTTCHIVAVGYYTAELYGMTEYLRSKLDMLEEFYRFPEIRNIEPFGPHDIIN